MEKISQYSKALAAGTGILLTLACAVPASAQVPNFSSPFCGTISFCGELDVTCDSHGTTLVQLFFNGNDVSHPGNFAALSGSVCIPAGDSGNIPFSFSGHFDGVTNDQWDVSLSSVSGNDVIGNILDSGNIVFHTGNLTAIAIGLVGNAPGSAFSFNDPDPFAFNDASETFTPDTVPEVDPRSAAGPIALVLGGLLMVLDDRQRENKSKQ